MPRIFALNNIPNSNPLLWRVINITAGQTTTVTIGDAQQTQAFLRSMQQNQVNDWFVSQYLDAVNSGANAAVLNQIRADHAAVNTLLDSTEYFEFLNQTLFVAPIGSTLAEAIANPNIMNLDPAIPGEDSNLAEVLGDILEAL
jgi:hypothetical protein